MRSCRFTGSALEWLWVMCDSPTLINFRSARWWRGGFSCVTAKNSLHFSCVKCDCVTSWPLRANAVFGIIAPPPLPPSSPGQREPHADDANRPSRSEPVLLDPSFAHLPRDLRWCHGLRCTCWGGGREGGVGLTSWLFRASFPCSSPLTRGPSLIILYVL